MGQAARARARRLDLGIAEADLLPAATRCRRQCQHQRHGAVPLLATLHAPIVATPGEMRGSKWRRERLFSASYALGWRVYDYAGHQLVFHGGAVQGYRGVVALLPERDLGVVILWNSDSSLPSGLLPTIIDRAIGLPAQRCPGGVADSRSKETNGCAQARQRNAHRMQGLGIAACGSAAVTP